MKESRKFASLWHSVPTIPKCTTMRKRTRPECKAPGRKVAANRRRPLGDLQMEFIDEALEKEVGTVGILDHDHEIAGTADGFGLIHFCDVAIRPVWNSDTISQKWECVDRDSLPYNFITNRRKRHGLFASHDRIMIKSITRDVDDVVHRLKRRFRYKTSGTLECRPNSRSVAKLTLHPADCRRQFVYRIRRVQERPRNDLRLLV